MKIRYFINFNQDLEKLFYRLVSFIFKQWNWHVENLTNNSNNLISSIDNDEERGMHLKGDNIKIMMNDEADEVIKELIHLKESI